MKPNAAIRPLALSVLLSLASVGMSFAQTADPSATITPFKTGGGNLHPGALRSGKFSPAATEATPATTEAKPMKPKATAEEKATKKKARLEKYDKNKDGKLDKSERNAMRAEKGLPPLGEKGEKAKASPAL